MLVRELISSNYYGDVFIRYASQPDVCFMYPTVHDVPDEFLSCEVYDYFTDCDFGGFCYIDVCIK